MADEKATPAGMDSRKKKIIGVIVVIVILLLWQMSSMFGGGETAPLEEPPKPDTAMKNAPPGTTPPPKPQQTAQQFARPLPMSQRETELLKLQQETQTRYVAAMNELQMLKLSLEIAETNKGIMAARLETIKNQKDIVDMLTPVRKTATLSNYSQPAMTQQMPSVPVSSPSVSAPGSTPNMVIQPVTQMGQSEQPPPFQPTSQPTEPGGQPVSGSAFNQQFPGGDTLSQDIPPEPTFDSSGQPIMPPPTTLPQQQVVVQQQPPEEVIPYTVVSVSKIQNRWNAVIGVQGALYSVHIGDIIPADGSRVKDIGSTGIVLEKQGRRRKVSLVPII